MNSAIRRGVGQAIGAVFSGLHAHHAAIGDTAAIFLFHRVDDRYAEDPLTVSVQDFRDWCDFIGDYFEVKKYSDIVSDIANGVSVSGKAAITFDDGYLDNYQNAAPVLAERDQHATFFVATNFIGSDKVPYWDRDLGVRPEWMTWDNLREMRDGGFAIENHSMDHLHFGEITTGEAREQLIGASDHIERELGVRPKHFAYPFGSGRHMSEANRKVVRDLGFASCCTAMNLLAPANSTPFNLHRYAVNSELGPSSLALGRIMRLSVSQRLGRRG